MKIGRGKEAIRLLALMVIALQIQPVKAEGEQDVKRGEGQATSEQKVEMVVQMGHSMDIERAVFSPDGKYVVMCSREGSVRLWEVETGYEVRQFKGTISLESEIIPSVAFSPDGKYVVIGGRGNTARLWEVRTGRELHQFEGHSGGDDSIVFSPDGKYVLMDGGRLWEVESGREVHEFRLSNFVYLVGASPDGKYVVMVTEDKAVRLWDVETGREVRQFLIPEVSSFLPMISPNGKYVLTGSANGTGLLWEVETGREVRQFEPNYEIITSAAFSPDSKYVLTAGQDDTSHTVRQWEVETGREVRQFNAKQNKGDLISSVALSFDSKHVLTGSDEGSVRLWDVETGRKVRQFQGHHIQVFQVAFSPDGKYALTAGLEGSARLWDVETGREVRRFQGDAFRLHPGAFSPQGKYVLTGSADGSVRLWEVETGREVRRFRGHSDAVHPIAFSPDGKYIVTASLDGTARLWDVESGREVRRFRIPERLSSLSIFSPDGKYVLTSNDDNVALLWEIETGREVRKFSWRSNDFAEVTSLAYSADGRYALIGNQAGSVQLFEVKTGREVRQFKATSDAQNERAGITWVAFSPDGKYVLSIREDDTARLWEVKTGREIRQFQELIWDHGSKNVRPVAFSYSSAGKFVVTVGRDDNVKLWEVETGREVRQFGWETVEGMEFLTFSPDGKYLITGIHNFLSGFLSLKARPIDGTAWMWEIETGQVVSQFRMNASAVARVAFLPDGKSILTGCLDAVRLWDVETGRQVRQFLQFNPKDDSFDFSFSTDGKHVLIKYDDESALLLEVETGREKRQLKGLSRGVHSATFSPDSKYVLTGSNDGTVRLLEVDTGREVRQFKVTPNIGGKHADITWLDFSPDGKFVLTGSGKDAVQLWEVETWREAGQLKGLPDEFDSAIFSPDGKYVLIVVDFANINWARTIDNPMRLWEVETGQEVRRFSGDFLGSAAFSPDGKYVVSGTWNGPALIHEVETGRDVRQLSGHSGIVTSVAFSPDGKYLLTAGFDATTRLWDFSSGKELCRLISFRDGNWAVVDPQGRFDVSNLEEIKGLNWRMPDDPLHLLPLEIFMRDYYEPRLLPRILSGESFKPVGNILHLNRAQPKVEITSIESEKDHPDRVSVTVNVARAASISQKDLSGKPLNSDVFDLRLFRDGQIVAQTPAPIAAAATASVTTESERQAWRDANRIKLNSDGTASITFRDIKLPLQAASKQVEFTAYAFNEDRIKSQTARKSFSLPADLPKSKSRAYIVAVGVNIFQEPAFNLNFSVNDARSILQSLGNGLAARGVYEDVVLVPLISDCKSLPGDIPATKPNFKAVIDLLAGRKPDPEALKAIPAQLAARLRQARPDDLVLISFSTHGYADSDGNFYCVLSDTGKIGEMAVSEELLRRLTPRFLSSEELSLWLRDVDGGEMMMIVDACHSAALAGKEFKPGPMGSRGLGQLSYDKGMRILTATQADNIAIGAGALRQGLLTYALVREGIERGKADHDPVDRQVRAQEWLRYGEQQVPRLYEQIRNGEMKELVQGRSGGEAGHCVPDKQLDVRDLRQRKDKVQLPSLFDFSSKNRDTLLVILGNK